MQKLIHVGIYVLSIVGINYVFAFAPMWSIAGIMLPSAAFLVGFVFVVRDFAQRSVGHWVLLAMLAGSVISYHMATPQVATASLLAFIISELIDWAIYTFTKRPFEERIMLSSLASTPVDSVVFLSLIGFFSPEGAALMSVAKLVGACVVLAGYKVRSAR